VGAAMALRELYDMTGKRAIVFGAGGMARASIVALQTCKAKEIFVCNRTPEKAAELASELGCKAIALDGIGAAGAELFFNATPVGMDPKPGEMPVSEAILRKFDAVADAVAMPRATMLISAARKLGKAAIPGYMMASYQSSAQFKIYTGIEAPVELVRKRMMEG
jgi:shikimate 5-dehydrogenase